MACICERRTNQLDKDLIHKISPYGSNIDNDTDSEKTTEARDTPHDDILYSELVVEKMTYLMKFQWRTF